MDCSAIPQMFLNVFRHGAVLARSLLMSTRLVDLRREDIVGKRITGVFQSLWSVSGDYSACEVYVLLDNGVLFVLDTPEAVKISRSAVSQDSLRPAEFSYASQPCIGEVVQEVLVSDYWPSIGLLLSSNRFLYCSDDYSPKSVGACLAPVGGRYGEDDLRTFWGSHRVKPNL